MKPNDHYKISQFYRRKNSVGVWLEVHWWFFYRRHHRRNTFVGFTFIGDSPFRRYISRKNKKTIYRRFYRRNVRTKKKIPAWNIPMDFHSVGDIVITDRKYPSVTRLVNVWNTDRICSSVNSSVMVEATVKCRRINSVGKSVGERLKYRPN